jgi:hypothetical protein
VLVGETLADLHARGQPYVLVGDFNIQASCLTAWLAEQGMASDFHVVSPGPTCHQNPSATAIDYAIVPTKLLAALGAARVCRTSLDVHDCFSLKFAYGEGHPISATLWHKAKRVDPSVTHRPLYRGRQADAWLADARQLLPSLPKHIQVAPAPRVEWERLSEEWLSWAHEELSANLCQTVCPSVGQEFRFTQANALQDLSMHTKPSDTVDLHMRKVLRMLRDLKGTASRVVLPAPLLGSTALRIRDLAVPMHWDAPWGIADDLFALQHTGREFQETQLTSWISYIAHELGAQAKLVTQASRKQWKARIQKAADMNKWLAFDLIKKEQNPPVPSPWLLCPGATAPPPLALW